MLIYKTLCFISTLANCFFLSVLIPAAHGDEPQAPLSEPPKLEPVFSDDFTTDTRGDYEIKGDVSWESGKLTLAEGASIQRAIDGGAWAKVTLEFGEDGWPSGDDEAELRVWLLLQGATSCFVRLRTTTDGDKATGLSASLIDTVEKDGRITGQLVRKQTHTLENVHRVTITYRHGLVSVHFGAFEALDAYIVNGAAAVTGTLMLSTKENLSVSGIAASAEPAAPPLSESQQQQVAEADNAYREMFNLHRQGKFDDAATVAKSVLEISKSVLGGQHPRYAKNLHNLAFLYVDMGDYAHAEPLYQQAVEIQKSTLGEQHPDYANSLTSLSHLYQSMADYARAEPLCQQAMEIRKSVFGAQHPSYATSLNNLAFLYYIAGDYARAEPLYQQSVEIDKSTVGEQHHSYAVGLNNLALLYKSMGDYVLAEQFYRQAVEIKKSTVGEQHPSYATSLKNLAMLYTMMGSYTRAEPLFQQAMKIQKSVLGEQHPTYAESLNSLAFLYYRVSEYARAASLYQQAVEIWKSTVGEQHPFYATGLNDFAMLYTRMGNYTRAELLHRQALETTGSVRGEQHPDYASTLYNLAFLYSSMADYSRAEHLYTQAVQIQRSNQDRNTIVQSWRQQNQNQNQLRFYLDSYLANALQLDGPIGQPLKNVWQWKGAVTARQQAYRQVASKKQLAPLFQDLQSVSRQLSALSGRTPIPPRKSAPDKEHSVYQQQRKIWESRFQTLNRQREELEQRIAANSEEFRRIQDPLTVTQVQQSLPEDTAFVDFLEYRHSTPDPEQKGKIEWERRYIAFVLRPDQEPAMVGLGSAQQIADAITDFRRPFQANAITVAERQAASDAAQQLRGSLWLPLEKHLVGIDTVIISPDTALGTLPWGALPGKRPNSYLIEDYRIATLPMANQMWSLFEDESPSLDNRGLLVVGDVDYAHKFEQQQSAPAERLLIADASTHREANQLRSGGSQTFELLPGFRKELDLVHTQFQSQFENLPTTTLSGSNATETEFLKQAANTRILHVITHGYFSDPSVKAISQAEVKHDGLMSDNKGPDPFINTYLPGLLSGLAMAGANHPSTDPEDPRDGILRASEIEASSLQGVDLVVLSACETGLGKVAGGEGLTGLQRAFHVAGARSVIASLWKVDDAATTELMRLFYTNLWEKKMSKIDALREAQLTMLHRFDIKTGKVRGLGGDEGKVDPNQSVPKGSKSQRLDPRYWAAFQLSGDWR